MSCGNSLPSIGRACSTNYIIPEIVSQETAGSGVLKMEPSFDFDAFPLSSRISSA